MYKNKKIAVSIPAYQEEALISKTLQGIPIFVDNIYVVDDGSKDRTSEIVEEEKKRDDRIKLIKHRTNTGVGGAIISGFKAAIEDGMDIVAVMAGDNQMDPDYLDKLIDPIVNGEADFTKGNRLKKGYWKGMSTFRLIGNFILSFITKIVSGYWRISDPQNGYVALDCKKLQLLDLDRIRKGYEFENDLMVHANINKLKMKNVTIPARYGDEISGIKYPQFILKTLIYFIGAFFWRIFHKYLLPKK